MPQTPTEKDGPVKLDKIAVDTSSEPGSAQLSEAGSAVAGLLGSGGSMASNHNMYEGRGSDGNYESDHAPLSEDDTMFALEGYTNSWEQAQASPASDEDDDLTNGGVGVGARSNAGIASAVLGSSLKNGSLPIDIPMSPDNLAVGSIPRHEDRGSYSGSLVGSLREMSLRSRNEALKRLHTSGDGSDLGTSPSP